MTDPAALLPCPNPWCDGDKQEPWRSSGGWWRVGCQCGFDGPSARSPEEAIAAWNERTGQLVPRAAVDLVGANTLPAEYARWLSSIEVDVRVHDLTADEVARLIAALIEGAGHAD